MRRLLIYLLVFLLVGQGLASVAKASGMERWATTVASAGQAIVSPPSSGEPGEGRPSDGFWAGLWSAALTQIRAAGAALVRWVTGSLKEALAMMWERVRLETDKVWRWAKGLWQWMNLRGDVGPLR